MYYLNKLKDFKLYNLPILSISKSSKPLYFNEIFFIGNTNDDIISFLSSNILSPKYIKGLYTDRYFITKKIAKRKNNNQDEYYKKIKEDDTNSIIYMKRNISQYNGRNFIYDLTSQFNANESTINSKGINRIPYFIDILKDKVSELPEYKNKLIIIKIPIINKIMDINNTSKIKGLFSYLYTLIHKKMISEDIITSFKGVTFLFYNEDPKRYVKFSFNQDLNDKYNSKAIRSLITLLKLSNNIPLDKEEQENVIDEKSPDIQSAKAEENLALINKTNEIKNYLLSSIGITDNTKLNNVSKELISSIEDKIQNAIIKSNSFTDNDEDNTNIEDESNTNIDEILDELDNDDDFKNTLNDLKDIQKGTKDSKTNEKLREKLKEKQNNLSLNGLSIKDIVNDFKSTSIDTTTINLKSTINEDILHSNMMDFDHSYATKQMQQDFIAVLSSFNNDEDIGLYIEDIKSENTSTDLTKKMTYTIKFKDSEKRSHTLKIDYPIILNDRFMMIDGSKKLIMKQILLAPIVKIGPDEVEVTTNYRKFFMERFGRKLIQKNELYKKFFASNPEIINSYLKKGSSFKYRLGNSSVINSQFKTSIEYSDLSSFLMSISTKEYILLFNQKEMKEVIESNILIEDVNDKNFNVLTSINYDKDKLFPIGYSRDKSKLLISDIISNKIYLIDKENNISEYAPSIGSAIASIMNTELTDDGYAYLISTTSTAKSLTYTRLRIMNRTIPTILVLGYEKGLSKILNHYEIDYEFTSNNHRMSILESNKRVIKFKNGNLIYDSSKLRNTLLLEGLSLMDTRAYDFEEMDTLLPYIETYHNLYGSRNIGRFLHTMLSVMWDPITIDVCKQLGLPLNIIDAILYCNTLLETNNHTKLNDYSNNNYRIRCTEQVNAEMYAILAEAFKSYKDTAKNSNPVKISVQPNILIKRLMAEKTVDDFSDLNPALEIEKYGGATYKGLNGTNSSEAYTSQIRTYDKSMFGILGMSSPDSSNVGVVRQLSYNPSLKTTRGFLDTDFESKNKNTDIYTPSELLNSFTVTHADPPRNLGLIIVIL